MRYRGTSLGRHPLRWAPTAIPRCAKWALYALRPGVKTTSLNSPAMHARLALVEARMTALLGGESSDLLGGMAQEHLATGGKRLRARLALAAASALGAPEDAALAWATACELAHNATLVHDDVQDGDPVRRGQPTVWKRHGVAQAINAGDLLFMLPFTAVLQAEQSATTATLSAALASFLATVIRGQALECSLLAAGDTERGVYERMIRGKTSALFELPVYGAALIAGHGSDAAAALTRSFAPLGMLFQMQDDVLDLYGDKGREAPGGDIREGKISALVVEHLARVPADRPWLLDILRTDRDATQATQVLEVMRRFVASGARSGVLAAIGQEAQDAQRAVSPQLAEVLSELIELVLQPIRHLEV